MDTKNDSKYSQTQHLFIPALIQQLDRPCGKWRSITQSQGGEEYRTYNKEKEG
jgi:hypothetical protein